ncbi:hypothetical protein IC582_020211 [Cucumis melo]
MPSWYGIGKVSCDAFLLTFFPTPFCTSGYPFPTYVAFLPTYLCVGSTPVSCSVLSHLQNKMLHLKHLCKRSFRILHSSFLLGINKPDCIVWNHIFDTHLVTPDNKKAEWTEPTAHLTIWTEKDVEYYFNTAVGDYDQIPGWGDVNYVISCINIKEHWLAIELI